MSIQVAGHQTEGYRVNTDIYEGPLDLLLELIERSELDITTLAIAQVTDQYLAYLVQLEDRDPAEVSAFLVLAARLIQIKSAALLPRPPVIESTAGDEDNAEALARQLILYKRFKELAFWLASREAEGLRTHLRLSPASFHTDFKADLSDITLSDLIAAARQAFHYSAALPDLGTVVNLPRITIRDRIRWILQRIHTDKKHHFSSFLASKNRVEIVVTFLAMLELIKRHVIEARQDNLFGEIEIDPLEELQEDDEIEVEFNE